MKRAFREASDALVGYTKAREFRAQQEALTTAAQDARRLADIRYQGGATSYLEVLDADTRLFDAETAARRGAASRAVGVRRGVSRARRRLAAGRASDTLDLVDDHRLIASTVTPPRAPGNRIIIERGPLPLPTITGVDHHAHTDVDFPFRSAVPLYGVRKRRTDTAAHP